MRGLRAGAGWQHAREGVSALCLAVVTAGAMTGCSGANGSHTDSASRADSAIGSAQPPSAATAAPFCAQFVDDETLRTVSQVLRSAASGKPGGVQSRAHGRPGADDRVQVQARIGTNLVRQMCPVTSCRSAWRVRVSPRPDPT